MNNKEAVNWLINISADIGKAEHSDLWHYEQALTEIKDMLESAAQLEERKESLCKKVRALCKESKIEFFFVGGGESTWSVTNDKHIKKIVECHKAQLSQEDATKDATSDTISRQFEEIVVRYLPDDLCNYPEHKGKPYYSIKYIEDGECFVGFGTYNPEVLSQYLRDYFMPPAQPEERTDKRTKTHACDSIGREDALLCLTGIINDMTIEDYIAMVSKRIRNLSPVQPEKETPKRVLWSGWKGYRDTRYKCPNCNKPVRNTDVYCHRCGQKLMFPKISFTPYVEGQKQELIVRWDDEEVAK